MQEIALLGVFVLALASRALAGTWLHPSCVFGLAWGVFLAIPTLGGLNRAPLATLVTLLAVLGATVAAAVHVTPASVTRSVVVTGRRLPTLVMFGAGCGLASALLTQRANGIPYSNWLSLDGLLLGAQEVTVLRYGGGLVTPPVATALLAVTYATAVMAPYAAASMEGWRSRVVLVAPTAGGFLYALGTTAKAGMLIAACLTLGAWVAVQAVTSGGRPSLNARMVSWSVVGVGVVVVLFAYLTAVRLGGWTTSAQRLVFAKLSTYSGGGIPAYESWLHTPHSGPQYGTQTFAGIGQILLFDPSLGNAYADFTGIGPGLRTNVYTILRPLTEDFGLSGAALFLALGSVVAAGAYRRAVVRRSVGSSLVVALWLGVALFGTATSILTFVNVTAALAFAVLVIARTVRFEAPADPLPLRVEREVDRSRPATKRSARTVATLGRGSRPGS